MGLRPYRHPHAHTTMSLVISEEFQHILRVLNTNIDGRQKIMFALTGIKGVGRRFANLVCKKADVDTNKRAGELKPEEVEKIIQVIQHPEQFKIPLWFLNRQKDLVDGKYTQVTANVLDAKFREDMQSLKKNQMSSWNSTFLGSQGSW